MGMVRLKSPMLEGPRLLVLNTFAVNGVHIVVGSLGWFVGGRSVGRLTSSCTFLCELLGDLVGRCVFDWFPFDSESQAGIRFLLFHLTCGGLNRRSRCLALCSWSLAQAVSMVVGRIRQFLISRQLLQKAGAPFDVAASQVEEIVRYLLQNS